MNKKSAILLISLLFLVGVILYAWATGTAEFTVGHAITGESSLYTTATADWVKGGLNDTINFTITAPTIQDANGNISAVTLEFNEATAAEAFTWENDTAQHRQATVVSSDNNAVQVETWDCNATANYNVLTVLNEPVANNWTNWTCYNTSDVSQFGAGDKIYMAINMTAGLVTDELYGQLNFSAVIWETNTSQYTSEYDNKFTIDDQSPRLIEVNISDGNTTYANSTWGTKYFLNGPLYIEALIEDSQLEGSTTGGAFLGYLCNSSNASIASEGIGGGTEEVLVVSNQGVGTINQKGRVVSSRINCDTVNVGNVGGYGGGNETFNFVFLVNDTFNHRILLNGTDADIQEGSFWITLDYGELLPVIAKVNVTQTAMTTSDGSGTDTVSKTLNHGSDLDGIADYLAANIVTFNIELTGGNKPNEVWIVWNDTGAGLTHFGPAVIGGTAAVFGSAAYNLIDDTAALNASSVSHVSTVDSTVEANTTTVVYSTTLNLAGNISNNFAFWVYANNTGNNYTRISGPHRFIVDGGAPSLTMTPPTDLVISPRASITYSCKMSDEESGNNKIMWQLKKPSETAWTTKQSYEDVLSGSDSITFTGDDTNLAGEYDVKCLAIDAIGNEGYYTTSDTENFAVHYSTTEGGAGGTGGAAADIDLSTSEEITITEKQGVISTFTLDGTTVHTIKIKTVDEIAGTVTIVIESDPITITLKIGEMKEVDVDADGENDISVTLNKIIDGAADITTKRLTPLPEEKPTEEVPPTEKPAEEIPTAEAASKTWLWILIIVIIVVIGVGYWFMKRK